ncbi:ABC transporter [Paenibacillus durus ATCC 35681]|uniref:ABC transporter n=1 Tax=Paenibacillus durus ATCC 35681 TaxID=1333534 RepID=A0A0F7FGZ3_PAEDU|nr:ABC transporter [Paenibacillus durus ATCC 35681]
MLEGKQVPSKRFGRISLLLLSLGIISGNVIFHWLIFRFIKESSLPILVNSLIAIAWGSLGIYSIYYSFNWLAERFPEKWREKVLPLVFIGPAVIFLAWLQVIPTIRTLYLSLIDDKTNKFIGLGNYVAIFNDRTLTVAIYNNVLWVVVGTVISVSLGLLIAVLTDRSKFERIAKSIIFLPMAISFVATGVIWKFVFYYQTGDSQIGMLNAILVAFGGEPQAWLSLQPWNNLLLIAIFIWSSTGFGMVIFSAAIKAVPDELLEAARMDGAGETRIFFTVIIPNISETILYVTTTTVVTTMKIFDIIFVMTGGQYNTDVVATQFYRNFIDRPGYASALATLLLVAVLPIFYINIRQLKKQGGH